MKKKLLFIIFSSLLFLKSYSQDYKESGVSLALASGFGFREIKKIAGGVYAENTTSTTSSAHDFKYKPIYWSAAFAVKHKQHEFGIEFERQKYTSDVTVQEYNVQSRYESSLKFTFFNMYYKFLFPVEYMKLTPYLKGGLNLNIYTYEYEQTWSSGSNLNSTTDLHAAFSLHAGVNYAITKNFSAFTELGYGPIICKFGIRFSFLKNVTPN